MSEFVFEYEELEWDTEGSSESQSLIVTDQVGEPDDVAFPKVENPTEAGEVLSTPLVDRTHHGASSSIPNLQP